MYLRRCLQLDRNQSICKYFSTKSSNYVQTEKDSSSGLATLVFQKAPVNSLDVEFLQEMTDVVANLENDNQVRGILLKSKFHGKVFSAGLDVTGLQNKNDRDLADLWSNVTDWCISLFGCSKPVVAALNGHAVAGGCAFALMADYRVGFPSIKMGLTEAQMGIPVEMLNHLQIHSVHGFRFAEYSVLTGKVHSSDVALKHGMLDEVVELDLVEANAITKLKEFSLVPPLAYASTKQLMRGGILENLKKNRQEAITNFVSTVQSECVQNIVENKLRQIGKIKK